MSQYLFVYGTLDPKQAPPEIAPIAARFHPVGRASLPGVLYDFGEYPGAVFEDSRRRISGTVFRIPEDPEVLRRLDEYEGFTPSNLNDSLFIRQLRPVKLTDGRIIRRCWVYAYNRQPGTAQVIPGGEYRSRRSRPVPHRRAAS